MNTEQKTTERLKLSDYPNLVIDKDTSPRIIALIGAEEDEKVDLNEFIKLIQSTE
ncbi:MAG: hypothetical protein ACRDDZ_07930 [Marinifilaceae bacterium]